MNTVIEQLAKQALVNTTINGTTDLVYRPEGYTACVSKDFVQEYTKLLLEHHYGIGKQWAEGLINLKYYSFINKRINYHLGVKL